MANIARSVKFPNKGPKVTLVTASRAVKASEADTILYINTATQVVLTLPKITKANDGMEFQVTVGALASGTAHSVAPATGDTILFEDAGTTPAVAGEALVFTAATDGIGQYFRCVASYGLGWVPTGFSTHASLTKT